MQSAAPGASTPGVGRVLEERYRLDALLGAGGLGVVWRAFHLRLGKPVAVKLMQPEHVSREQLRARFEREARSLAALSHPNIVDVIDYGIDGDQPFLVMELLEGRSLDHAIRDGIAPERALAIARDIVRALAHAHAQRIVHRDLKPANVFLQRIDDGHEIVRVLDFGLAKFLHGDAPVTTSQQITHQGTVLGTPAYMAPEQAAGGNADARADVYSFGVLLFELLTGQRPFHGEGAELVRQHLLVAMPPLASVRPDLEIAPELEAVLRKATAKSPGERYASARSLMEALHALPAHAVRARAGAPRVVTGGGASGDAPTHASAELATVASGSGGASKGGGASGNAAANATARAKPGIGRIAPKPVEPAPSPGTASALHVPPISAASASTNSLVTSILHGSRRRALIGIAALGTLGVSLAIAGVIALAWFARERDASATAAPAIPAAPAVAAARQPSAPPAPFFAPDPDPWAGAVPPALAPIRARFEGGGRLSARERRALTTYATRHRDDPRGWLLLAHADFLDGARTDACDRYENALRTDEARARGDLYAVHDLARMAAHHRVGDRAASLLQRHWGVRALAAIDRAIPEIDPRGDREDPERLRALREQLVRSSTLGAR